MMLDPCVGLRTFRDTSCSSAEVGHASKELTPCRPQQPRSILHPTHRLRRSVSCDSRQQGYSNAYTDRPKQQAMSPWRDPTAKYPQNTAALRRRFICGGNALMFVAQVCRISSRFEHGRWPFPGGFPEELTVSTNPRAELMRRLYRT